jgi:hypothetical protein
MTSQVQSISAPTEDLSGRVFGYLTVLSYEGRLGTDRRPAWKCVCKCGNEKVTTAKRLKSGGTTSCGCKQLEAIRRTATKHGGHGTREYGTWMAMRRRCLDRGNVAWKHYGGRGITICERWDRFENFLDDMGLCPPGLTIDRKDVNGNYEPGNCHWATDEEQRLNKRIATHCKRGHVFTEESSYFDSFGRHCKICRRDTELQRYARKRAE